MIIDSSENKKQILEEFLKICEFDGWTNEALAHALAKCGISENFATLIFENGVLDVAEFYIASQNEKALAAIENIEHFHAKKIRDKIRLALYARFEVEKNHKLALQRLVNFYIDPKNLTSLQTGPRPLVQGLSTCYKVADFIWEAINDQSTDFNFYTKRLTLGKIILRTLFVFQKDESDDLSKTKKFIDSEIEKVMNFEKFKVSFKNFSSSAKKTFCEIILDEKGSPKSPKELIKNLPFIRLIKF